MLLTAPIDSVACRVDGIEKFELDQIGHCSQIFRAHGLFAERRAIECRS